VQRGLIGNVIERFERRGLKIVGLKMIQVSRELAEQHYAEHRGKPFFEGLVGFITSSPVVVGVLEGPSAIDVVRATVGATNPATSAPGTIRADFGLTIGRNLIHASDGGDAAQREVSLFFSADELVNYERSIDGWLIEA
jgi:nucleoside-diphosphate kinase